MNLEDLTKDERSLLLFLEIQAVDQGGRVAPSRMKGEDFETINRWVESGFITFCRIPFKEIMSGGRFNTRTHFVTLSDEAWRLAHEERRACCERLRVRERFLKQTDETAA